MRRLIRLLRKFRRAPDLISPEDGLSLHAELDGWWGSLNLVQKTWLYAKHKYFEQLKRRARVLEERLENA